MQQRRAGLFVTSHEGKLWAIEGNGPNGELSSIEIYDPELNSWSYSQTSLKSLKGTIKGCTYSSIHFRNFNFSEG